MYIKNITSSDFSVTLYGTTYNFPVGVSVLFSDVLLYHPLMKPLWNKFSFDTSSNFSNISDALNSANNPSKVNAFSTLNDITVGLEENAKQHHSNKNDPSVNQKEAMNAADSPTSGNPFSTTSATSGAITNAMNYHITHFDHSPFPLNTEEVEALHASTLPSTENPYITQSVCSSIASGLIVTHTGNATAHHSNANDPSIGEKAALVGTSGTVGSANKYVTNDHMNTHIASATAHHSNANDPTGNEKLALGGTYGTVGSANKYVTNTDPRMLTSDQKAGIAAVIVSAANPVVVNNDVRLSTATHPTSDEKAALVGTDGSPSSLNKYITNSDPRILTLAASQGVAGAVGLSAANPAITSQNLATHAATATAHHSNANDPSAGEKEALAGTSGVVGTANKYVTNDHMATHAGTATAHHSNANDPSTGEKAALAGTTGTPGSANKYVTETDSRMTNSRTPTAHASTHISGDAIQNCTSEQNGLMTSSLVNTLLNKTNDIRLQYTNTTSLSLIGINSKNIHLNYTVISIDSISVTTSDYLLDDGGELTETTPDASTLYYVYTNGTLLRLSAFNGTWSTTHQKYMLGSYMLVGWCRTNESIQFTDALSVYSLYNEKTIYIEKSGSLTNATSDTAWEPITGLSEGVLLAENSTLEIHISVISKSTTEDNLCNIGVNETLVASTNTGSVYKNIAGTKIYQSSLGYADYAITHYFQTASGSSTDGTRSLVSFVRVPAYL